MVSRIIVVSAVVLIGAQGGVVVEKCSCCPDVVIQFGVSRGVLVRDVEF